MDLFSSSTKKINGKGFLFSELEILLLFTWHQKALGNKLCSLTKTSLIKLWLPKKDKKQKN